MLSASRSLTSRYLQWVLALSLLRVLVVSISPYGLYLEEPYYWQWAQQPGWGYYSKPPLVAWLIAATSCWHDSPLAVKASAILLYPLAGWFVLQTTRLLSDDQVALRTALLFQLLPGVSFSAIIISTDVPLIVCWSASLWLAISALTRPQRWHWPALGIAIGLGLLAKYNMALLPPGLLLWGWFYRRQQLQQQWRGILVATAIALLVFTPTLVWNLQHQLTSLHHTVAISGVNSAEWRWAALGEFLLAQLGILGPVVGLIGGWLFLARPASVRPLLLIVAPALLIAAWVAGFGKANANWAAPAAATLAIGCGLWAAHSRPRWYWLLLPNLLIGALFYGLHSSGQLDPLSERLQLRHPYQRILGWQSVTDRIIQEQALLPAPCLISPSREVLAWAGYWGRERLPPESLISLPPADGQAAHHFDLVNPLAMGAPSEPCLLVVGAHQSHLVREFADYQALGSAVRQWRARRYEHFLLFEVSHWQGGGR